MDESYAGREFDEALIESLPAGVDPCGENGEFHTFCYASPVFYEAIAVSVGEIVKRDGFCFADLVDAREKQVPPLRSGMTNKSG